ncbi:MAG: ribosomal-processing cysteine protease Prp [Treponema sp.]|nr:ribosomal-processing cysteine protease Prp [Treponema sp.]
MTNVALVSGRNGVIKKCEANGHAGFSKKGGDIVCSAITILLRTAMQTLSQTPTATVSADTSSRGKLAFLVELDNGNPMVESRAKGVSDFLRNGLKSLSKEFPEHVLFEETTI